MRRDRQAAAAPIVGTAYDLCAERYDHVNRFPRAQRTLLGRVILDEALRMLTALTVASRVAGRQPLLAEASGHLDAVRVAVRLANRLQRASGRASGGATVQGGSGDAPASSLVGKAGL